MNIIAPLPFLFIFSNILSYLFSLVPDKILVTSLLITEEFILVNIDSFLLNSPKDNAIWI